MKILPFMSRGEVFLHEDGHTFEMVPFQVFSAANGGTIVRLGRNAFFFDKDGNYKGNECKVGGFAPDSPEAQAFTAAFKQSIDNHGLAPEQAYFEEGSPGYERETASWSRAEERKFQ